MVSSSSFVDRTLALKKQDYHVDSVAFSVFETTSAMLKKLKPYIDTIEKILEHEGGILKPSTILLARDLIDQYKEKLARVNLAWFRMWISLFSREQRKAIQTFTGNVCRGYDSLVREATDKTSPAVIAKLTEEAAKFVDDRRAKSSLLVDSATRVGEDQYNANTMNITKENLDTQDEDLIPLKVDALDGSGSFWVLFDLADTIHIGGFGRVNLVRRKDDPSTRYALKVTLHGKVALQDLEREMLIWQELKHKHILPLIGTTRMMSGRGLGLLSPYVEGHNLAGLQHRKNYSEAELITLLRQTCDAIRYLHGEGVIHGDIKPDNILVSSDGTALLCDFGLSKSPNFADTAVNHVGASSGSFLAPELRGDYDRGVHRSKTKGSDIFALGKTMAQVISGQPHDNPLPPPPETLCSENSKAVWALAERCCLPEASRPDIQYVADFLKTIEDRVHKALRIAGSEVEELIL